MPVLRVESLLVVMQIFGLAMFGNSTSLNAAPFNPKRVLQKTSLHVDQMQFQDVVKLLSEQEKMEITLDESVIREHSHFDKITLHVDGITLKSLLNILLNGLNTRAYYDVDSEGRVIYFAPDSSDRRTVEVSYPLADLAPLTEDLAKFIAAISLGVNGEWSNETGDDRDGAIVSIDRSMMTVKQTQVAHRQIAELLMKMAASASGRSLVPTVIDQAEVRVWKSLQKVSPPPKGELTLDEFIEQVFVPLKIPYWIDRASLAVEGIKPGMKFTPDGKRRPVQEMLITNLEPQKISFLVEDEIVKIMSEPASLEKTTIRVYNVKQFVNPVSTAEQIAEKLTMTPGTGRWEGVQASGLGDIRDVGPFLIVKQTSNAHRAIAAMLYGN